MEHRPEIPSAALEPFQLHTHLLRPVGSPLQASAQLGLVQTRLGQGPVQGCLGSPGQDLASGGLLPTGLQVPVGLGQQGGGLGVASAGLFAGPCGGLQGLSQTLLDPVGGFSGQDPGPLAFQVGLLLQEEAQGLLLLGEGPGLGLQAGLERRDIGCEEVQGLPGRLALLQEPVPLRDPLLAAFREGLGMTAQGVLPAGNPGEGLAEFLERRLPSLGLLGLPASRGLDVFLGLAGRLLGRLDPV